MLEQKTQQPFFLLKKYIIKTIREGNCKTIFQYIYNFYWLIISSLKKCVNPLSTTT